MTISNERAMDALQESKRKYEVRYSESAATHRRNLLFSTVLSFAALIVSPKDGVYTINLGVISGIVEHPMIIYLGLLSLCIYQVYFFWIICRQSVIDSINLRNIENVYMYALAALHAVDYWHSITMEYRARGMNTAIENFKMSPKDARKNGNWKVRSETQLKHLDDYSDLVKKLKNDKSIELSENRGFYQIDYTFIPTADDYKFLMTHRDHFWLTKKRSIIENVFPLVVGYSAIIGLTYKIVLLFL